MSAQGTWYVKSPDYRVVHLAANGHKKAGWAAKGHGSTNANPWLLNARNQAEAEMPAILRREIEAIK